MANEYAKRIVEIELAFKEDEHPDIKTKDIRFLLDCLRIAVDGLCEIKLCGDEATIAFAAELIARLDTLASGWNERATREE